MPLKVLARSIRRRTRVYGGRGVLQMEIWLGGIHEQRIPLHIVGAVHGMGVILGAVDQVVVYSQRDRRLVDHLRGLVLAEQVVAHDNVFHVRVGVIKARAPARSAIVVSCIVDKGDVLDGTPLLDIKPYIPEFNVVDEVRTGWLEEATGKVTDRKVDHRFE